MARRRKRLPLSYDSSLVHRRDDALATILVHGRSAGEFRIPPDYTENDLSAFRVEFDPLPAEDYQRELKWSFSGYKRILVSNYGNATIWAHLIGPRKPME